MSKPYMLPQPVRPGFKRSHRAWIWPECLYRHVPGQILYSQAGFDPKNLAPGALWQISGQT